MANKLAGLLGLARRAGKITAGTDAVIKEMTKGHAKAVLLASDASPRTQENIKRACAEKKIGCLQTDLNKEQLGASIGRGETAVTAVADSSFAKRMTELSGAVKQEDDGEYDDEIPRTRSGQGSGRAQQGGH